LEQAEIISAKNHTKKSHFANHLKDDDTMVDESIEWIEKIYLMCCRQIIKFSGIKPEPLSN
jgi:hypothetical protein